MHTPYISNRSACTVHHPLSFLCITTTLPLYHFNNGEEDESETVALKFQTLDPSTILPMKSFCHESALPSLGGQFLSHHSVVK